MEREFIPGNKMITEFMDYEYTPRPIPIPRKGYAEKQFGWNRKMKWSPLYLKSMDHSHNPTKRYHLAYTHSDLKFHSHWEWIMPVVFKILFKTGFTKEGEPFIFAIQTALGNCEITNLWKTVIRFLEWHNQQLENKK